MTVSTLPFPESCAPELKALLELLTFPCALRSLKGQVGTRQLPAKPEQVRRREYVQGEQGKQKIVVLALPEAAWSTSQLDMPCGLAN